MTQATNIPQHHPVPFNQNDPQYTCFCQAPRSGLITAGLEIGMSIVMIGGVAIYMVEAQDVRAGCWIGLSVLLLEILVAFLVIRGINCQRPALLVPYLTVKLAHMTLISMAVIIALIALNTSLESIRNYLASNDGHSVSYNASSKHANVLVFYCSAIVGLLAYLLMNVLFFVIGMKCYRYICEKLNHDRVQQMHANAGPQVSRYYHAACSTIRSVGSRLSHFDLQGTGGSDILFKVDLRGQKGTSLRYPKSGGPGSRYGGDNYSSKASSYRIPRKSYTKHRSALDDSEYC